MHEIINVKPIKSVANIRRLAYTMSKRKESAMAILVNGTNVLALTIWSAFGAQYVIPQKKMPQTVYQNS